MNLYIRIIDGQPFEHPIFEDNFKEAFPHIDVDNLPSNFAKFIRVQNPHVGALGSFIPEVAYQWVGDVVMDVWTLRPMTPEEIEAKRLFDIENVIQSVNYFRGLAVNALSNATDTDKIIWQQYIDTLDNFLATFTNPYTQQPPRYPLTDENGLLLSTNDSGSAPNVIG